MAPAPSESSDSGAPPPSEPDRNELERPYLDAITEAQAEVTHAQTRVQALGDKLNPMSTSYIYGAGGSNDANEELRVRDEMRQAERELEAARQKVVTANQNLAGSPAGAARPGARVSGPGPSLADILIVEDKESLRTMLRTTLESRGYAVDEAGDAYEARRRLQAFRYLVVLTDLKLPAGSGLDVLQAAREADAETPVVVMTAFGTVEEAVRAMKQGAADFLTKPVDTDHLLLLLDRAVERRRVATELVLLQGGLPAALRAAARARARTRRSRRRCSRCSAPPAPTPPCCCWARAAPARS